MTYTPADCPARHGIYELSVCVEIHIISFVRELWTYSRVSLSEEPQGVKIERCAFTMKGVPVLPLSLMDWAGGRPS